MRIGFLNHSSSLFGANRSLVGLIKGLSDYPVEPFVILRERGDLSSLIEELGVTVAYVPYRLWVDDKRSSKVRAHMAKVVGEKWCYPRQWLDEENVSQISGLFRRWGIDLVHSNSVVIPTGIFVARRIGVPHIWYFREFLENYGFHFLMGSHRSEVILNSSDASIAVSQAIADRYFDSDARGIRRVIYNGVMSQVDFDNLRERNRSRAGARTITFGMIGQIQSSKNFAEGIRAFSMLATEFPQARLAIAGSGATNDLKCLVEKLKITSQVDFLGFFADPREFYFGIDALLMCSRKEAMGRVTIEAFAFCKPVIGFDAAGTSELIEHDKTGFLYSGGATELATCMRRCLIDPEAMVTMGLAAWKFGRRHFTNEACAHKYYQVVDELMAQKPVVL